MLSVLNAQCGGKKAITTFLILSHLKNERSNQWDFLFTEVSLFVLWVWRIGSIFVHLLSSYLKKNLIETISHPYFWDFCKSELRIHLMRTYTY